MQPNFAHIADCHIGVWRSPVLREYVSKAFSKAIDICIEKSVDFVLIAGDLFNTPIPQMQAMQQAVADLKRLKDKNIPVYLIAGSHDVAPSGASMLDVLEEAGLFINVFRGKMVDDKLYLKATVDPKTNTAIVGVPGKAGMLDKEIYETIEGIDELQEQNQYKIFMFHTALSELVATNPNMRKHPLSLLPKGFDYYAGGHVHIVEEQSFPQHKKVVYPGPLFPADFSELEDLGKGGFYLVDQGNCERIPLDLVPVQNISIDVSNKDAQQILTEVKRTEIQKDSIITWRVSGSISNSLQDLALDNCVRAMEEAGAQIVLKNTRGIVFPEQQLRHIPVKSDVQEEVLQEHAQELGDVQQAKDMIDILGAQRQEGQTKTDYEKAVVKAALEKLVPNN